MQLKNHSVFIVNPRAGSGRAGYGWPKVGSMAKKRLGDFHTRLTSRPGDAVSFAKEAVRDGAVIWNVVVGNGCFHGAGMKVAPEAKIDDGLFHVTILGNMNLIEA